jgi:uncharacterized membrane protein YqjE
MALTETVGRIGTTLVAMLRTRLELAAVEAREEAQAMLGVLAWTLLAAFLGAGACLLLALFVVVLFWDSYRLLAIGGMAGLFLLGAILILLRVRSTLAARAPMLAATRAELGKDLAFIAGTGVQHEA